MLQYFFVAIHVLRQSCLLLNITVNLVLGLVCKLSLIVGAYDKRQHSMCRIQNYLMSQRQLGPFPYGGRQVTVLLPQPHHTNFMWKHAWSALLHTINIQKEGPPDLSFCRGL